MLLFNKSPLLRVTRRLVDILYHKARANRVLSIPVVGTPEEKEILSHLKEHGWAKVPDTIGSDLRREILNDCVKLQHEYKKIRQREGNRHKSIWNYLSDIKYAGKKPDENDRLVQYALLPPILNVAASYMGEIPWLRYIILTESVFQPGDIVYSQKWHLDFDDARMLKLFIYLSDVRSAEDGPFRMLGRKATLQVKNSFFRRHLSDKEVFSHASSHDVIDVLGPALSAFMVDTSRVYHCGSRLAEGHSRLLYTALFTGFPSVYPQANDTFSVGPDSSPLLQKVLTPFSYARKPVA